MIISESIDEIIEKHNKTRLTYALGVIPLIILVIFIFTYESHVVRTEKKFKTNINVNTTTAKLYKIEAASREKLKKSDIITTIDFGKKVTFLDSVDGKWIRVVYLADTGILKNKDCSIEKVLYEEEKIRRFATKRFE